MKGKALFGVPCGRGKAAWGDGDAENTRARALSFFPSLGRSMIEMLGVLAIIGVLSAGGIWGYTSAMTTYRTNKFMSDITDIVIRIQSTFPNPHKTGKRVLDPPLLHQIGIINDEYFKTYDTSKQVPVGFTAYYPMKSPFGTSMSVFIFLQNYNGSISYTNQDGTHTTVTGILSNIAIGVDNLPKAACIKILTTMSMDSLGFLYGFWSVGGSGVVVTSPITISEAENLCVPLDSTRGIVMYSYIFFSGTAKRVDS